jgi:K(+)-stimulated pyrophosphate-energized sodium pump
MKIYKHLTLTAGFLFACVISAFASEANLEIPDLHEGVFHVFGGSITAWDFLFYGAIIIAGTLGFSLYLSSQIKKLPVHSSMAKVAQTIYETCRTYLIQQGRFLLMLFGMISVIICVYFLGLLGERLWVAVQVLFFSIIGMLGAYSVACMESELTRMRTPARLLHR